jgi:Tfp pilus assembly protein PilZ
MIVRKIRAYIDIPTYPIDAGHKIRYAMTITNISLSGCFIKTDQRWEVGTHVNFTLPLTAGKMLSVKGTVAREHGEPHGYGVSFEELSNETRGELALLIADSMELLSQESK